MTVKWIQLRIDTHPEHFCIAAFESSLEQIERFFGTIDGAVHECEMVGRYVTPLGKYVHLVKCALCLFEFSCGRVSTSEACQGVRRFAHQLDEAFRSLCRFRMTAECAQNETQAVKHHQV